MFLLIPDGHSKGHKQTEEREVEARTRRMKDPE